MTQLRVFTLILQVFLCQKIAAIDLECGRGLEGLSSLALGYVPTTDVSGAVKIDCDQDMIEYFIGRGTREAFDSALEIYQYGFNGTDDVLLDDEVALTLQSLSTRAHELYLECDNCPYSYFQKFYNYYGRSDYGDAYVLASFDGTLVEFESVDVDMTKFGATGRSQGIMKGTAYLIVWMKVIGDMEMAIDECASSDGNGLAFWDTAAAFYTGRANATENGHLIYSLANKRCKNFHTCTGYDTSSGIAQANEDIMAFFSQGQEYLSQGLCEKARDVKDEISSKMTALLIQGSLRYLYRGYELGAGANEKLDAETAIFVASVIPLVASCNEEDAKVIQMYATIGYSGEVNYDIIKQAFENNYDCMNVKCEDVGGLWDDLENDYFPKAEPCVTGSDAASVYGGIKAFGVAILLTFFQMLL